MRFDIYRLYSFLAALWRFTPLVFWVGGITALILIDSWLWGWLALALTSLCGWGLNLLQSRPSQQERLYLNHLERVRRSAYHPRKYRW